MRETRDSESILPLIGRGILLFVSSAAMFYFFNKVITGASKGAVLPFLLCVVIVMATADIFLTELVAVIGG